MIYHPIAPSAPLDRFVETIFHVKNYQPEHSIERIVPDASSNIVIELDGQRRWVADNETHEPIQYCEKSWVSGVHRRFFSISALPGTELLAIRFRIGGLYPLLKQSLEPTTDRVVAGSELLGDSMTTTREQLIAAGTSEEKVRFAERWLIDSMDFTLTPPVGVQNAIEAIQADPSQNTLKNVVEQSGYSRKQFIHLFKVHTGLRPKDFQRILRFSQALASIQDDKPVAWTDLSTDCGYFDQSHFIRDFKHFSGFNPSEFLQTETDRANFFPIQGDEK